MYKFSSLYSRSIIRLISRAEYGSTACNLIEEMTRACATPRDQLYETCLAGDIQQIQELFQTHELTAEDATKAFEHVILNSDESDQSVLRYLLKKQADPNAVSRYRIESLPKLKFLVEFRYDIKGKGHLTLQYIALQDPRIRRRFANVLESKDFSHDREMLDWMLDQGVDVSKTDTSREANGFVGYKQMFDRSNHLLNNVAAIGDIELFDHLVDRGADPSRSLALHEVSRCKDDEKAVAMVHHLLDKYHMDIHADTDDLQDFFHDASNSGTPLCSTMHAKNLAVVEALLKRGSSVEKCGVSGRTPICLVTGDCLNPTYFTAAVEPLLGAGADPTFALLNAVRAGMLEAAKMCLEHGADPAVALEAIRKRQKARSEKVAAGLDPDDGDLIGYDKGEGAEQRSNDMVKLLEEYCRTPKQSV